MATGVEQAIAEVKQDITEVKDEIAGLKAGLKDVEDREERKIMLQRLAALEQRLTVLSQKELLLLQQQQQQPGAGAAASGDDLQDIKQQLQALRSDVGAIRQAAAAHLSATLAASNADEGKLLELRRVLRCAVFVVDDDAHSQASTADAHAAVDPLIEQLLRRDAESSGFKWQEDVPEPQQRDLYLQHMMARLAAKYFQKYQDNLPRGLGWAAATSNSFKYTPQDCPFPVSSKNDEVLMLRAAGVGATVAGLEVKKLLDAKAIRQAEVEFYVWDYVSNFPFCQIVTDFNRGGVAFYFQGTDASGGRLVCKRVLGNMNKVYSFIAGLIHGLPEHMLSLTPDAQGFVFLRELPAPKRLKMQPPEPQAQPAEVTVPAPDRDGPSGSGARGGGADDNAGGAGGAAGLSPRVGGGASDGAGSGLGADGPGGNAARTVTGTSSRGLSAGIPLSPTEQAKVLQLLRELQQESDVACLRDLDDFS